MSCDHKPPKFGCKFCIGKRGRIYENDLDYYMQRLLEARNLLSTIYNEEKEENVYLAVDLVINRMEEILLNVSIKARLDFTQGLFYAHVTNTSLRNRFKSSLGQSVRSIQSGDELCSECDHGFYRHHIGCSKKSTKDPIYPSTNICATCKQPLIVCDCGSGYLPVRKAMSSGINKTRQEEAIDRTQLVSTEDPNMVNHPAHYGGKDNPYEVIKVIEAWGLGFCLGNVVKYIARAGKKTSSLFLQDLKKAQFYLDREIQRIENPGDHIPGRIKAEDA